jgi:pyochelin synthetase
VVGVQSRALGCARLEHESLEWMAAEYAQLIRAQHFEGPVRLLGWSMGAAVAAYVAAALERDGMAVESVTMLDPRSRPAPGTAIDRRAADVKTAMTGVVQSLGLTTIEPSVVAELALTYREAVNSTPGERAGRVVSTLRRSVPSVSPELLDFVREQVLLTERHEQLQGSARFPPLRCPVAVFVSDDVDEERRRTMARELGPGSRIHRVRAGHFSILAPPAVARVARHLAGEVRRKGGAGGARRRPARRA